MNIYLALYVYWLTADNDDAIANVAFGKCAEDATENNKKRKDHLRNEEESLDASKKRLKQKKNTRKKKEQLSWLTRERQKAKSERKKQERE